MKLGSNQKRLDIIISGILLLFLLLASLYRFSPIDFMNPGFPILRGDDLKFSDRFLLPGYPKPKRSTDVYDFSKVTYEIVFRLEDTSQVFPDNEGEMETTGFSVFQFVSRFSNPNEAERALQQLYEEYVKSEGDLPIRITDIPIAGFSSKADKYLLWCEGSRELTFSAEEVHSCYYWAVYDPYLSRTSVSMWPIRGWGRQFSLDLFIKIITAAETKIISKIAQ
jgi:hypothetical protein